MLLIGFVIHFWVTPQEGVSANEKAAANLARMEASVKGVATKQQKAKSAHAKFMQELKKTRERQVEYLTIIVMILGALALGSSFIKPKG